MGATDIGSEGAWKWIDSGNPVPDFAWYINDPNGGIDANCFYWHYSFLAGADDSCTSYKYPLCQIVV